MFDPQQFSDLLQKLQDQNQEFQEQNKNKIYTSKSGGGLISVSVNGEGEVIDLSIDPSLLEDRESLQILLMSAINEAYQNVSEGKKRDAFTMLGNLKLFG